MPGYLDWAFAFLRSSTGNPCETEGERRKTDRPACDVPINDSSRGCNCRIGNLEPTGFRPTLSTCERTSYKTLSGKAVILQNHGLLKVGQALFERSKPLRRIGRADPPSRLSDRPCSWPPSKNLERTLLPLCRRCREARAAFGQSVARLQQASGAAVAVLLKVMTDPNAPASSRVRAAQSVLDCAARAIEIEDVEVRVASLTHTGSYI
jgi:hypothetical protein